MNMVCASIYLYLLRFLLQCHIIFQVKSFTSLVKFIPKYFIVFKAIVSGIVFLISLSDSSLLAYKNATDFWILILYPTLLNSFISSGSFWVESLRLFMCSIMSFTNNDSFTLFPNLDAFYFFFCLSAVARTSSTMLSKRGESGHLCLFPILRGMLVVLAH